MSNPVTRSITYRADIDGMRALAVLTVMLFHANIPLFSGGYVGVDIFFVISGYLITSIIYLEMQQGRFTFRAFWLRRARRILPASLLVMTATILVFAFVYPVVYFQDLGRSAAAQSVFMSNVFFWTQSGYFGTEAELKPLLHMWTLAVEEQFYLFFPALLWVLYKFFKNWLASLIAVLVMVSLGLSTWAAEDHAIAAFYLLPTRAWELGLGALLGIISVKQVGVCKNISVGNFVSVLSLIMVLCVVYFFDEKTPFPSYYALAPVAASVALIWSNSSGKTWIGHLLSSRPFVWIGLISYSLYLWHWPINVLGDWMVFERKSIAYYGFVLGTPFILAFLSYRFIETPFRKNREVFSNNKVVLISMSGSIILLVGGLVLSQLGNGYLVDRDGKIRAFYTKAVAPESTRENCGNSRFSSNGKTKICEFLGNPRVNDIDYFIWGDSHAGALMPAFLQYAEAENLNIEFASTPGCQPVIGMKKVGQPNCPKFNNTVMKKIEASNYRAVIIVASFVENIIQGKLRDADAPSEYSPSEAIKEFENRFNQTIEAIHATGTKVVVFTEPPRQLLNPINDYLRRSTLGIPIKDSYLDVEQHMSRIGQVYGIIDKAGIDLRLDYSNYFCSGGPCKYLYQGEALYKDSGHISNFGTRILSPKIGADLEALQ